MPLSIKQLQNPPTRTEIASWMVEQLRDLGFVTTGWQPGRVQQSMIRVLATVAEPFAQTASSMVTLNFNSLASGVGLRLYSSSRFNNTIEGARKSRGYFVFTNVGTVAHTVEPNSVLVEDANGTQFQSAETVVVSAGASTNVLMEANLAGQAGNIPNNSSLRLVTNLAGVTVTNPSPSPATTPQPLWASVVTGSDEESDSELKVRNASKWGILGAERADAAMINMALGADGVTKAKVISDNPRGPGTIDIVLAGTSGPLNSVEMAGAQQRFSEYTFLTESSWPPSSATNVAAVLATSQSLDLVGTVYYDPSLDQDAVEASVAARLDAALAEVPIGGYDYSDTVNGILSISDITEIINLTPGVNSCTVTSPAGDVPVGSLSVLTRPSLGWFDPTLLVSQAGSR